MNCCLCAGDLNKMKKFQKILVIVGLFVLAGIWAIVAFGIKEEIISRFSLWADLVVGCGTIMVSVIALMISVSSYKRTEALRKQKITEEADKFINDNNDEILYIPLCLVANAFDKHHKFKRKIYNNFNVLNKDLQKEILKQLNYEYVLIENNSWIDKEIEQIRSFIRDNDLGHDLLYDGAKYFHRSMEYADLEYDGECEYGHFMPDHFHWNPKIFFKEDKLYQENVSFDTYVDSFLAAKQKNDPLYVKNKKEKPMDVLIALQNLRDCSEETVCYWMMQVVFTFALILQKNLKIEEPHYLSRGDAKINTFEDRYLECLMELYNLNIMRKQKTN